MPTREHAPVGAPCWTDLFTSDVEGSRTFYSQLFGWEAQQPSPEFGDYFMFTRNGVPVAGGMGDMGDIRADNRWKIYLSTDDIAKTVELAEANGAHIAFPPEPVADLGMQSVLEDSNGAVVGAWQPGTFPGFTVLGEHGAPGWFELFTRNHARALDFYRTVFRWETRDESDTDEFRYSVMRDPSGDGELAGVMDASAFLPEGVGDHWSVYWEVDDADAAIAQATSLGGSLVVAAEDTPYGRLATVTDPAGAQFKLHSAPAS